ncbi:MAG: 2-oxoglutarate dehydrogenase complex dihydrolipoyllysine-residue succinyltransferase [Planctomycetota bacterium]
MPTDIVIPEVGESVTSGVIAAWTKAEGEWVERDETVLELETDKITMEVPAPAAGVVKHGAREGDEVDVGAVVGSIDESAERSGAAAPASAAASEGGDAPKQPAAATAIAEAPSKQPETPARANGAATPAPGGSNGAAPTTADDVHATPLARKLAAENQVDLRTVHGTGAGGRIREQDVLAAVQSAGSTGAPASSAPAPGIARGTSLEKMSPMRQKIASRLVEAQQTAAMLTTFNEVDMTSVMALRKQHKESFGEKHGVNLGFMSFFVRAVCGALRAYPAINSYIVRGEGGAPALQHHDYCDVAIAVSSPKGLVVPVLRNAESMSFAQIEATIKDFAVRSQDGKLGLEEMQGGTFTITNGGVFGSLMSTPILNPPQSAILGMHAIKKRAVEHPEKPGEVALRPMMYLALSYDHRVVDGAGAVRFLVHIKEALESPARMLLEL